MESKPTPITLQNFTTESGALLHLSGENITKIKGIFSGTLSYLFNDFSAKDVSYSEVLKEALDNAYM